MSGKASRRRELGDRGETIAANYLKQRGYELLETNYRCPWGEVDLILREGDCLVFVEVRARTGDAFGTPAESVTYVKRERLVATAETYLQALEVMPKEWRIDLVSIVFAGAGGRPRVEHVKNIVDVSGRSS